MDLKAMSYTPIWHKQNALKSLLLLTTLFLSFNSFAQQLGSVTHFSGTFKNMRSSGHISKDSLGNLKMVSMLCVHPDNNLIFYYRLTKYRTADTLKYDSIVDFSKKRKAQILVRRYTDDGQLQYERRLRMKRDPNETTIPLRADALWQGTETYYDASGKKTSSLRLKDVKQ